ncbi:hypothetical protein J1605_013378 [Eschrichtius robustus]|uniref:Uncharacterized protein n=1 Tax=Eschrichtius robustus TaxID=9764 RepID=A0AB34GIS1_ESCRO|nr:hypothetical protein J1605_013378 [Eschrichtius robustus]
MGRAFAYLEVNQSTRSLQGTTRTSGLNFLGNRCWTESARGGYAGSLDCSSECVHLPAFTPPTPHAPRPEGVLTLAAAWYFNAGQVSVPAGGKSGVPLTPEAFVPVVLRAAFARQVGCCRGSPSGATLLSSPGRHLPQQRGWRLGARGGLSASGCYKVPLSRPPL